MGSFKETILDFSFVIKQGRYVLHQLDPESGWVQFIFHLEDGRLHRAEAEGPAFITYISQNGGLLREEYYQDGLTHRVGGPATICYDGTLNKGVVEECYQQDGEYHRDPSEGPAYRRWHDSNKRLMRESYYWKGKRHRDSATGPAEMHWHPTSGRLYRTEYYMHGRCHRDPKEGPAIMRWQGMTGALRQVEYWVDGKPLAVAHPIRPDEVPTTRSKR